RGRSDHRRGEWTAMGQAAIKGGAAVQGRHFAGLDAVALKGQNRAGSEGPHEQRCLPVGHASLPPRSAGMLTRRAFVEQRRSNMTTGLQLRSLISKTGQLEVSLVETDITDPGPDQVLAKVEATPINPSDLGLLLGPADVATARTSGSGKDTKLTAQVPSASLPFLAARLDQSMPVGNEGAGTVIKA